MGLPPQVATGALTNVALALLLWVPTLAQLLVALLLWVRTLALLLVALLLWVPTLVLLLVALLMWATGQCCWQYGVECCGED